MARIRIGDHSLTTGEIQDLLATDHPMVQQFRFEPETQGDRLYFALRIVPRAGVRYRQQRNSRGKRIEPRWRTLSGRERIGEGNRVIWREGDQLVAENCTFFPNQEFNDLGIGSALYVSVERLYRHLGIRRVTLLAVDVGRYVWARQGFAFSDADAGGLRPQLEAFAREQEDDIDPDELVESWDFANYDCGHEVDGYRAGKAFMLGYAPPWYGVKYLDRDRHNRVAEASRRETFARLPDTIDGALAELAVR